MWVVEQELPRMRAGAAGVAAAAKEKVADNTCGKGAARAGMPLYTHLPLGALHWAALIACLAV